MTKTLEKEIDRAATLSISTQPSGGANLPAIVDLSTIGEANNARTRINIPLNLRNWKDLSQEHQDQLLWFHQYILDNQLGWKEVKQSVGYDQSTLYRVLKGTYDGSWANVVASIKSFRKVFEVRSTIQKNVFAHTPITRLVWDGLDYAMANNTITLIVGESRMGKTASATAWRDENNHGRSVFITAPPYGGSKMFVSILATAVGASGNRSVAETVLNVHRAFNKNRMLIVDEAHRLLPGTHRHNPVCLEFIRDLHDMTQCGLAILSTERFDTELNKSNYMFEQLIGRIGMPIRLPRKLTENDILPIATQFISHPSDKLMAVLLDIANFRGRLGIMVETFKVASRMSAKEKRPLVEQHVLKAIALRKQMQGEIMYAAK